MCVSVCVSVVVSSSCGIDLCQTMSFFCVCLCTYGRVCMCDWSLSNVFIFRFALGQTHPNVMFSFMNDDVHVREYVCWCLFLRLHLRMCLCCVYSMPVSVLSLSLSCCRLRSRSRCLRVCLCTYGCVRVCVCVKRLISVESCHFANKSTRYFQCACVLGKHHGLLWIDWPTTCSLLLTYHWSVACIAPLALVPHTRTRNTNLHTASSALQNLPPLPFCEHPRAPRHTHGHTRWSHAITQPTRLEDAQCLNTVGETTVGETTISRFQSISQTLVRHRV